MAKTTIHKSNLLWLLLLLSLSMTSVRAIENVWQPLPSASIVTAVRSAPSDQTIAVFDPAISKIGFLQPSDIVGADESIEWMITIINDSTQAGINLIITDTLRPELQLDRVVSSRGVTAINGQTAVVTIPVLNPGESVQISIMTTTLQGTTIENTACVNADNLTGSRCATGQVVRSLPATGENPLWAGELLTTMIIGQLALLWIVTTVRNMRRQTNAIKQAAL